jgi:hypothetical protein
MIDYIGLIFELILLALGIYAYLFSIGKLKSGNPEAQKKAEAFRKQNGWLKYAALALIAMMIVNIYLHLVQV